VFSYAEANDLLKIGLFNKETRNQLEENALKGLMNEELKVPRQLQLKAALCTEVKLPAFALLVA